MKTLDVAGGLPHENHRKLLLIIRLTGLGEWSMTSRILYNDASSKLIAQIKQIENKCDKWADSLRLTTSLTMWLLGCHYPRSSTSLSDRSKNTVTDRGNSATQ